MIKVTGTHRRPQDSHELLRIAGSNAKKHKCSHFLFDMRETTIAGDAIGAYETAINPEKHGFSNSFRIAAVYPAVEENEKLMENVAVNRGATAFQVFDDIVAAREWMGTIDNC